MNQEMILESTDRGQILASVTKTFEERIPFNKILGFEVKLQKDGTIKLSFQMRDELIGNFLRGNLHGGVISSSLDVVGGLVAFTALLDQNPVQSFDERSEQFSKLGTVDLRVDFLRPGLGESFIATGYKLRAGRRIAVARMELHNDSGLLIAVGTGTYSIG
jgi:uncharacterized protein (TIGR00369 family)